MFLTIFDKYLRKARIAECGYPSLAIRTTSDNFFAVEYVRDAERHDRDRNYSAHGESAHALSTAISVNRLTAAIALIHNGDSTHHHDQLILPVSLRPMNSRVSKLENPILTFIAFQPSTI